MSAAPAARWAGTAFPAAVFALSRAALFALTAFGLALEPRMQGPTPVFQGSAVLQSLCRWDCFYYREIAWSGYREAYWTNFFPLFPLLGRGVSAATGLPVTYALIALANAAALAGLIALYALFRELEDVRAARAGVLLFAFQPFAYFQGSGYPESLMLLFTVLAMRWALRGRHGWAGAALAAGALSRHLALAAGPSLLAAQLRERGWRFLRAPAVLALALPLAACGAYFLYVGRRFGDPWAWWRHRAEGWGPLAWYGVVDYLAGRAPPSPLYGLYVALSLAIGAGAVLLLRRERTRVLAPFALGMMAVLWTVGLAGLGRYSASCWPAFLPLGRWLSRRPALAMPLIAALAAAQGLLIFLFTHGYEIT